VELESALSPVGPYSGFEDNGLALRPFFVALIPVALSPENRLVLIPLAP
jgi:hypothetical protein